MNKSQAEKKVYTFHAVFRVDVKPFQNPTEMSIFDHLLDPQSMPRIFKAMKKVNKQCLLDTPRTVRVSEKTWQVIVRTRRP